MRDSRSRLKVDTIYVLGAGSSYASTCKRGGNPGKRTAPLDNTFCRVLIDLKKARLRWVRDAAELLAKNWHDHVPFIDFGLEKAILRQLSHYEYYRSIYKRKRPELSNEEFINIITHLIAYTLHRCKESPGERLKKLSSIAFPPNSKLNDDGANRIITFNYDDLLDQHLLSRNFRPQTIYFDAIKDSPDTAAGRGDRHSFPLLLKLHGSINWRCQTDELNSMVSENHDPESPYIIDSVWIDNHAVPSLPDDESPCIIPPMANKQLTGISLFRWLWQTASEYLHEARKIVVCGYSLPETDTLALSLFGNIPPGKLEEVTIVDRDPAVLTRWRSLLVKRRGSRVQWTYHDDFCDYIDALQ